MATTTHSFGAALVFFITAGSAIGAFTVFKQDEAEAHAAFGLYQVKHGRVYKHSTGDYDMRKALFEQRLAEVHAHNARENRLWTAELNHFSDQTHTERKAVLGYNPGASEHVLRGGSLLQVSNSSEELPESKDWLHLKSASRVHDQGSCGSCWAFATTAVLEAHYEIYSGGKFRSFSQQQTLECTPNPKQCGGSGGCAGATATLGLNYILKNGIDTEEQVPYLARTQKCSANGRGNDEFAVLAGASPSENSGASFGLVGVHPLESNNEHALAQAVATYGPVAISVAADQWFSYSKGIFDGCKKDSVVDHAVTLFGYGTDSSLKFNDAAAKYWTIRNSWGPSWGEKGFIRMHRRSNYCGTDNDNQAGSGCKGDAKSVKVCGMCGMLFDSVVPRFHGAPGHTDSAAQMSIDSNGMMRSKTNAHVSSK